MGWALVGRLLDDGEALAGLTPAQALVVLHLANYEGTKGAYPSERSLAKKADVSRNTVRAALATVESRGLIVEVDTYRGQTRYRFTTGSTAEPVTGSTAEPVDGDDWLNSESRLAQSARATGSIGLACKRREEKVEEGTRASARRPRTEKVDKREPWQIVNDAAAAAELERTRERTPEELAEIERKRAHVDHLDKLETVCRDNGLGDLADAAVRATAEAILAAQEAEAA